MPDQKLDNLLNLAMDATPQERAKSENLNVGYDSTTRLWDVIVKYSEPERGLGGDGIQVVPLLGGYAVVTLPETELDAYSDREQVEFIEKPKRLYFETFEGREASCILPVQAELNGLTGEGILVGIVDSGVDYFHPDFRNEDGSSRILRLWDQSVNGNPPESYVTGTEYTKEEIDKALALEETEGRRLVPSRDFSGHGTAVLGIAAGNGRASGGVNRGVAYESELLVVKMGNARENSFPRTTELMEGIDYLVRQAVQMGKPIAINISFGNTYGSHDGTSLLERYLNTVSERWKNVICVGSGNEGTTAGHAAGEYRKGMMTEVQLAVQQREKSFSLQIWKSYVDEVTITIVDPSGNHSGRLEEKEGTQRIQIGETELLVYYGEPKPYSIRQEIYISFLPRNEFVTAGVWKIQMMPGQVVDKLWQMWLPVQNALNIGTAFLKPDSSTTLTIPSTASLVITVAAYNALTFSYADFSGRGPTQIYEGENANKPDLAAPGVRVMAPVAGGGYAEFTGTSFATPFVTGSAALLMEWGIVKGNDPYLYGEKVKAYLRRGARQIPGYERWPNGKLGYGRLCIVQSIPGM